MLAICITWNFTKCSELYSTFLLHQITNCYHGDIIRLLSTSSLRPLHGDFPCVKSPPGGTGVGCMRTPCKVPYRESEKASWINHTVHRQKSWFTRISRLSRIRLSIRVSVRISISVRITVRVRYSSSGLNLWTPMAVQK